MYGFPSVQAMEFFVDKYCELEPQADGSSQLVRSEVANRLLQTTMAVCAVRSFDNVVTPDMAQALVKSFKRSSPKQVPFSAC